MILQETELHATEGVDFMDLVEQSEVNNNVNLENLSFSRDSSNETEISIGNDVDDELENEPKSQLELRFNENLDCVLIRRELHEDLKEGPSTPLYQSTPKRRMSSRVKFVPNRLTYC